MARRIILGRRNWVREPGVTINPKGAAWPVSLDNLKTIRPKEVTEAATVLAADTKLWIDLLSDRWIGAINLENLRLTTAATIRVYVTNNALSVVYDSGIVSAWPVDSTPGGANPWGVTTATGAYNAEFYEALGFPRVFVPPAIVSGRYLDIDIVDTAAPSPPQIGVVGAWEIWEPPLNYSYDSRVEIEDGSLVSEVPDGSTYVTERGIRRILHFGFGFMPESEYLARQLDYAMVVGKRRPVLAIRNPDAGGNLEKDAVHGLVANSTALSNPLFQRYAQTYSIRQLI